MTISAGIEVPFRRLIFRLKAASDESVLEIAMPRDRTRFCVEVDGKPRELFIVKEDPDGSLTLLIRSAEYFGHALANNASRVHDHKISVHHSKKSDRFNTIHMTQELVGREPIESHVLTDAVKCKTGFCQIYFRRCPNLNRDFFLPETKETKEIVVIDEHYPLMETLVHSVLIGPSETPFDRVDGRVAVTSRTFGMFRVVVLSSRLFGLPTHPTGSFSYAFSFDTRGADLTPETKILVDQLTQGLPAADCVNEFWLAANCLMEVFCKDRLKCQIAPVPPGELRDHISEGLARFSAEADNFATKVRPAVGTIFREPSFWDVVK
jgi:hypothetical protein